MILFFEGLKSGREIFSLSSNIEFSSLYLVIRSILFFLLKQLFYFVSVLIKIPVCKGRVANLLLVQEEMYNLRRKKLAYRFTEGQSRCPYGRPCLHLIRYPCKMQRRQGVVPSG